MSSSYRFLTTVRRGVSTTVELVLGGPTGWGPQTHLIAHHRHRRVALGWLAALLVLIGVGFAPIDPTLAAAGALATAVVVAGLSMAETLRRDPVRGADDRRTTAA